MTAKRTHCAKGHPFDEANTNIRRRSDGRILRTCRKCEQLRIGARRAAKARYYAWPRTDQY
jgi:RNase P subunit RPR2